MVTTSTRQRRKPRPTTQELPQETPIAPGEIRPGDRVRGRSVKDESATIQGIVTRLGRSFLIVEGNPIHREGCELLQQQVLDEVEQDDLIRLLEKGWEQRVEALLESTELGFSNDRYHDIRQQPGQRRGEYRGWEIFSYSGEVQICKNGESWSARTNSGPPMGIAYQAIDTVELGLAAIEAALNPEMAIVTVTVTPEQGGLTAPVTLEELAGEINRAIGDIQEAMETAWAAESAALSHCRTFGNLLTEAKRLVKAQKLNWEGWRDENIINPKTGKAFPSATATLYQRIAERWDELEQAGVKTVREAQALLARPRMKAEENPQHVGETVIERDLVQTLQQRVDDHAARAAAFGAGVSEETAEALTAAGVVPCKPSISPEEFNREMWGSDDPQDWGVSSPDPSDGGQQLPPTPDYEAPAGVLKLRPVAGGHEVYGLVLTHQQFKKLVALAAQIDPRKRSLKDALFSLIDQLPEV